MTRHALRGVTLALTLVLALGGLAGCATDPAARQASSWVVDAQHERERLESLGFPQCGT